MDNPKDQGQTTGGAESYLPPSNSQHSAEEEGERDEAFASPSSCVTFSSISSLSYWYPVEGISSNLAITLGCIEETQELSKQDLFSSLDATPNLKEDILTLRMISGGPLAWSELEEVKEINSASTEPINHVISSAVDDADALAALVSRQDEAFPPSRRM